MTSEFQNLETNQKSIDLNEEVKIAFINEFELLISKILIDSESEFMNKLKKKVLTNILNKFENVFETEEISLLISKLEKLIYSNLYLSTKEISLKSIKIYEDYLKTPNKIPSEVYINKCFMKHCFLTEDIAFHTCNGKLIKINSNYGKALNDINSFYINHQISNNYEISGVICVNCKYVYFSKEIYLKCTGCETNYYSKLIPNQDFNLQPATWKNYHCGLKINDYMKCILCKEMLYLNMISKELECKKCLQNWNPLSLVFSCIRCKKEFSSEAKIYNEIEFSKLKQAISEALLIQEEIIPEKLTCCGMESKDYIFTHKKDCDGKLVKGVYYNDSLVICTKCKAMNSYMNFLWTCPNCSIRFTLEKTLKNKEKNKEKSSEKKGILKTPNSPISKDKGLTNKVNFLNKKTILDKGHVRVNSVFSINSINSMNSNLLSFNNNIKDIEESKKLLKSQYHRKNNSAFYENTLGINMMKYSKAINNKNGLSSINIDDSNNEENKSNLFYKSFLNNSNNNCFSTIGSVNSTPHNIKKSGIRLQHDDKSNNIKEMINPFKKRNITVKTFQNYHRSNTVFEETKRKINLSVSPSPDKSFNSRDNKLKFKKNSSRNKEKLETRSSLNNMTVQNTESATVTPKLLKEINYFSETEIPYFNVEEYKIIHQIGEGSFGCIYLAIDKHGGKFALKKIIIRENEDLEVIFNEFNLSFQFQHPNILQIFGKCIKNLDSSTRALYILMELAYCDWKKDITLRQKKNTKYKESQLINITRQIVDALSYLQTNEIAHRDIKPQNILVMTNSVIKVSDFGCAKELDTFNVNTLKGTELFISPVQFDALRRNIQLVDHNVYKSDVYSLGLCLLYAGCLDLEPITSLRKVNDNKEIYEIVKKNLYPNYSLEFVKLIYRMLEYNEDLRFDFIELDEILRNLKINN